MTKRNGLLVLCLLAVLIASKTEKAMCQDYSGKAEAVQHAIGKVATYVFGPPRDAWDEYTRDNERIDLMKEMLGDEYKPPVSDVFKILERIDTVSLSQNEKFYVHRIDAAGFGDGLGKICVVKASGSAVSDDQILHKVVFAHRTIEHLRHWKRENNIRMLRQSADLLKKMSVLHKTASVIDGMQSICSKVLAAKFTAGLSAKSEVKDVIGGEEAVKALVKFVVWEELGRWANMLEKASGKLTGCQKVEDLTYSDRVEIYYLLSNIAEDLDAIKTVAQNTFPAHNENVAWYTLKKVANDLTGAWLKKAKVTYGKKALDRRLKFENALKYAKKTANVAVGEVSYATWNLMILLEDIDDVCQYLEELHMRNEYVGQAFVRAEVCFLKALASSRVTKPESVPMGAGRSILIILDTSGSMSDRLSKTSERKIEGAIKAARELVKGTIGPAEWALMTYDGCRPRIVVNFTSDSAIIVNTLERIRARGNTPLAASLELAGEYIQSNGMYTTCDVVLLSDGMETCGGDPVKAARDLYGRSIDFTNWMEP
jgi:hypothetical protein